MNDKGQTNGHANGAGINGSGAIHVEGERRVVPAPPDRVKDLAEGCVRFVERALKVKLDYEVETLSLLDHYVAQGRKEIAQKPELAAVIAHAAGAYLGEVVRRRHASWWSLAAGDDPALWRIELEQVYLSFSPVQMIADALLHGARDEEHGPGEQLELEEEDRDAIAERLAELPAVSEAEFYAPSTRVEVLDIAVEAIRARHLAADEGEQMALTPDDYE